MSLSVISLEANKAAQTLAGFATADRDEVNAERLINAMVGVIDEAIQPTSMKIWLK